MNTDIASEGLPASGRSRWLRLLAVLAAAGLLSLAAWPLIDMARRGRSGSSADLADFGPVPTARLTERSGSALALSDLKGRVWVANFIFTRCGGSCLVMSSKMQELQDSLARRGNVMLVSFTVDPEFDTPQRLGAYAEGYRAKQDKWLFLTGGKDQMQDLARNGFHLGVQEGGDSAEPIIHSKRFVLVDVEGRIRGYYNSEEKDAQQRLLRDVATLVEEGT